MSSSKSITKMVEQTIKVYERSPHRCHPDCDYCEKDVISSGQYDCTLFMECIDGHGDDTDGYDHYGFMRCKGCVARFGMPKVESEDENACS